MKSIDLKIYFNFRSPYCYLASKRMFDVVMAPDVRIVWRPLGGWKGRSPPERAAYKLPIARQDVARWCKRLKVPYVPPPKETDPTRAGAGSFLAEKLGLLRPYIVEMMREEWEFGQDIGQTEALARAGQRAGLPADQLIAAVDSAENRKLLADSEADAAADGAFGVPTFVVGKEVFWGQDRLDFLAEHLDELRRA